MSMMPAEDFDESKFSGKVRLFPLPNLVLFPHVLQPLHVFEPRYRELMTDALADDRLIALAVLAPGWQADYEGRPPVHPVGCLGRVMTSAKLDDGRFNLLLAGVRRFRLVQEQPSDKLYREARVELIEDEYAIELAGARDRLARMLLDAFQRFLSRQGEVAAGVQSAITESLPLGTLTDLFAYAAPMTLEDKLALLAEPRVDARAVSLLERFAATNTMDGDKFPPDFSLN
ncbi:MAG: LON peptidase substrate-binding domain-containing protein [Pirellulales bacterium]|nr:LON peptidase substrate-binding domain-containing protein [Pirellulales bacterium]